MRFSEKSKQAREQPVKTVRLTPKTSQDLEDIWFYGYHHFGEVQADNCINPISDFFRYYLNNSIRTPRPELIKYINALPSNGISFIFYKLMQILLLSVY